MHENIRDVMSSRPKTLDADQTVAAAAQLMRRADIGDVLVVKSDDRLHGIVTDRDIVVRVLAEGLDPNQTRVGDICSRVLTTVSPDDGVSHAVRVMREKAIRRLPVEAGGRVIGMLTIGDIAVERDVGSVLADISAAPPNTQMVLHGDGRWRTGRPASDQVIEQGAAELLPNLCLTRAHSRSLQRIPAHEVVVSISYGGRQLGAAASVVALHFAEDFALERCRTVSRASVNETLGSGARTFLAGRYSIT